MISEILYYLTEISWASLGYAESCLRFSFNLNWLKSQECESSAAHKKLLLCDTDLNGVSALKLHYHYTLDSHSLIKPLKLCCLLFLRGSLLHFLRAFILHNTQIIHTSHGRWSRGNFLWAKPFFGSNSFSCPSHSRYFYYSDTFISFHIFIYTFTQEKLFAWLFTYFLFQSSNIKISFLLFRHVLRQKKYSKRMPISHPKDDKIFLLVLFFWSQEKCYEISSYEIKILLIFKLSRNFPSNC